MASREERQADAQRKLRQQRAIQQMQSGLDAPTREPSFKEQWQSFGVGAGQAFTLGWGDEIMGQLWGTFSPDLTREEATKRVRRAAEEVTSKDPTSAGIGGFVGGGAMGLGAVPRAGRFFALGDRPLITQPVGGAAVGATAGAGEAPTMGDIPEYMGQGAMFGGVAGAAFPALTRGIMAAPRLPGALRRNMGGNITPEQYSRSEIRGLIEGSAYTPDELRERFATMGPNTTLADVLGDPGGQALRQNIKTSEARGPAVRFLEDRQDQERDVLRSETRRALGVTEDVPDYQDALLDQRSKRAQRDYDAAYAQPVEMTEDLRGLLERPAVKDAYRKAQQSAANAGRSMPEIFIEDADGNLTLNTETIPDFRSLDFIKRRLDAEVRRVGRQVELGKGSEEYRDIRDLRNEFREYLKGTNEKYGTALENFAGDAAMLDAIEEGRNIFDRNLTERDVRRILDGMTESEQAGYRMGVYDAVDLRMKNIKENRQAAEDFMTENVQEKMRVLAGPRTKRFAQQMRGIQQRKRTSNIGQGGSNTPRDLVQAQEARQRAEDAARLVGRATQVRNPGNLIGVAMDVVSTIFRRNKIDVTPEQRAALAEALLSRSPEVLNRAIKEQYRGTLPPVQLTRWANRVANSLTGAFANPTVVQQAIRGE